jgi:hypothetical protein
LIPCSGPISGLGCREAGERSLRVAEDVGVAGPDDAPAGRHAAEQVELTHLDPGDAVLPGQHPGHSSTFSASATVLRARSAFPAIAS